MEVATLDKNCCDGKEISPGVWGIGELCYNKEYSRWQILAQVGDALCLVEVSIKVKGD